MEGTSWSDQNKEKSQDDAEQVSTGEQRLSSPDEQRQRESFVRRKFIVRHQRVPTITLQSFRVLVPRDAPVEAAVDNVSSGTCAEQEDTAIMNSTDSLNFDEDRKSSPSKTPPAAHQVDTLLQGAEMQESPRGGSVNSSVSSSPPARRDAPSVAPSAVPVSVAQFCAGGAAPIAGHQLLVNPATGQHYLVPSGPHPQPQLFYHPVYYSPTPVEPLYYQPFASGAQGAYILAPPVTGAQQGVMPMVPPGSVGQRFSMPPSVSVPPSIVGGYASSVADSEDLRSLPVGEDHQSFLQHRAQKDASRASDPKTQRLISTKSHSPPSSPPHDQTQPSPVFAPVTAQRSLPCGNRQDGSSQTGATRVSPAQAAESRPEQLNMMGQRTPLFGGTPAWWGEGRRDNAEDADRSHTDVENSERRRGSQPHPTATAQPCTMSDSETVSSARAAQRRNQSPPAIARKPLKPVRMDIDLNTPFEDDEKKKEKVKVVLRAPPTAFTVTFDSNEGTSSKMSLQDAARKSTTRRLLRRSAPASGFSGKGADVNLSTAAALAESADPKQYLLNKMLMGSGPCPEGFNGAPEFLASPTDTSEKRDTDCVSEAGTYVVDEKDRHLDPMSSSQRITDSDDDSDSSDSTTTTRSSDRTPSPPSTADVSQVSPRIIDSPRSMKGTSEKSDALLRELLRLRADRESQQTAQSSVAAKKPISPTSVTSVGIASSVPRPCMSSAGGAIRSVRRAETQSSSVAGSQTHTPTQRSSPPSNTTATNRLGSASKRVGLTTGSINNSQHSSHSHSHCLQSGTSTSATAAYGNQNFRRVDGGRFSMRTASSGATPSRGQPSASSRINRPPFRFGNATRNSAGSAQKESAEMTAWLRRKDYNPMKAAAEAKKLQQLKARTEHFTSNRSVSFHQGAPPATSSTSITSGDLSKSRHNKSQDDLLNEDAGCGPETILASYSKGVTRDLRRLKLAEESSESTPQISSVEKAVQALALKCNRSIELIRSANQGHLSESVESLLDRAMQPAKNREGSVAEQLDRLSAAFDAIQKYLEVSSCSSAPTSPTALSSSPTHNFSPNPESPTFARTGFKSRMANAKRSPSGSRSPVKS